MVALALYRFQDLWATYRSTAERLKTEKYRYLTHTAPYGGDEAFAVLVARVEEALAGDHERWASIQQSMPAGEPGAAPGSSAQES